jgi:hypothetical protein
MTTNSYHYDKQLRLFFQISQSCHGERGVSPSASRPVLPVGRSLFQEQRVPHRPQVLPDRSQLERAEGRLMVTFIFQL